MIHCLGQNSNEGNRSASMVCSPRIEVFDAGDELAIQGLTTEVAPKPALFWERIMVQN